MSPLFIVFVILHFVPIVIVIGTIFFGSNFSNGLKISLYLFAVIYGIIIYSSLASEFYFDFKLSQFDLNNDGMFSGAEVTVSQQEAMRKVTSDTGRTLAPFTGLVFSGLLALIFFIGYKVIAYVKKDT
jgi:hypothetical protein